MTDPDTDHRTNRGTTLKALSVFCAFMLVFAGVGAVAQPALADHEEDDDEGLLGSMFADDSDMTVSERISVASSSVSAILDRTLYGVTSRLPGRGQSAAADAAEDVTDEFNDNSDAYTKYVNDRFTGTHADYDNLKIVFRQGDEKAVRYLQADISDIDGDGEKEYTNVRVTEDTQWEVDGTVTLEGYATANAAEELQWFRKNYVEEGKDPDLALRRKAANGYLGLVDLDGSVDYNISGGA